MQLRRALGLLPLALLFLAWQIAVELKVYPPVLLAPPAKVLAVFEKRKADAAKANETAAAAKQEEKAKGLSEEDLKKALGR